MSYMVLIRLSNLKTHQYNLCLYSKWLQMFAVPAGRCHSDGCLHRRRYLQGDHHGHVEGGGGLHPPGWFPLQQLPRHVAQGGHQYPRPQGEKCELLSAARAKSSKCSNTSNRFINWMMGLQTEHTVSRPSGPLPCLQLLAMQTKH